MDTLTRIEGRNLRIGRNGRVVIPIEARRALNLDEGDELLLTVEGERLILETERALLERLYEAVGPAPEGELVSDALIRERREEAAREASELDE